MQILQTKILEGKQKEKKGETIRPHFHKAYRRSFPLQDIMKKKKKKKKKKKNFFFYINFLIF